MVRTTTTTASGEVVVAELIDDMPAWPPGTGHLRGVTAGEIHDVLGDCDEYVAPMLESLRETARLGSETGRA